MEIDGHDSGHGAKSADEMEPCTVCQRRTVWRYGNQGTCTECRAALQHRLYTHRVAVPGLAPETMPPFVPYGEHTDDDLPKTLIDGTVYAGNKLTVRSLEELRRLGVKRILHIVDESDDLTPASYAPQAFEYKQYFSVNFSAFDVYDQLVESVSISKVKVAVYGVKNYQRRTGTLVLLAFLMEFAGLELQYAKDLLVEKGIITREERTGGYDSQLDDLADMFAGVSAS